MTPPRTAGIALAVVTALALSTTHSPSAFAFHEEDDGILDGTARTLPQGSFRLGPNKTEYSILDSLTAGTTVYPWFLLLANIHVKWRFLKKDRTQLATNLALFRWDSSRVRSIDDEAGDAVLTIVPWDVLVTYRVDTRNALSGGPVLTLVRGRGSIDSEAFVGTGEGAVDNLQLTAKYEHHLSRVTALTLTGRYLVFQVVTADATSVTRIDDFTTIEISGAAEATDLNFRGAGSVSIGTQFSWEHFNLRLGVGYGAFNLPVVNFVSKDPAVFPELDIYWVL